jgi:hypothetical protein
MKSCRRYDKGGKLTGSRCNHYCHTKGTCCKCGDANCGSDPVYNPEDQETLVKHVLERMQLVAYGNGIESGRVD